VNETDVKELFASVAANPAADTIDMDAVLRGGRRRQRTRVAATLGASLGVLAVVGALLTGVLPGNAPTPAATGGGAPSTPIAASSAPLAFVPGGWKGPTCLIDRDTAASAIGGLRTAKEVKPGQVDTDGVVIKVWGCSYVGSGDARIQVTVADPAHPMVPVTVQMIYPSCGVKAATMTVEGHTVNGGTCIRSDFTSSDGTSGPLVIHVMWALDTAPNGQSVCSIDGATSAKAADAACKAYFEKLIATT
jgi:hypothetical protein